MWSAADHIPFLQKCSDISTTFSFAFNPQFNLICAKQANIHFLNTTVQICFPVTLRVHSKIVTRLYMIYFLSSRIHFMLCAWTKLVNKTLHSFFYLYIRHYWRTAGPKTRVKQRTLRASVADTGYTIPLLSKPYRWRSQGRTDWTKMFSPQPKLCKELASNVKIWKQRSMCVQQLLI